MTNTPGVIVLGGHVLGYGIIKIYADHNIPSVVIDTEKFRITKYSRYCKAYYTCAGDDIVDFLIRLGREGRYNGWLVIPTDDFYLRMVSQNKQLLNEYFIVTVDNWEIVEKFYNKKYAYPLAERAGVPIPKIFYPRTENELERISRAIEYPCIIKPSVGHFFLKKFNTKVFICNDWSELRENYKNSICIMDTGDIMVQEIIPGNSEHQYSVGMFYNKDRSYNHIVARRKRQSPPDFGTGTTYAETVENPELVVYAEKILGEAGYFGICEVEFKYDTRDRKYKFLEVNARIWRWHSIAEGASIPFLLSLYQFLTSGKPIVKSDYLESAWRDDIRDIPTIYKLKRRKEYKKCNKKKTVHAVFNIRDIKPLIIQILSIPYYKIRGSTKKLTGYN